MRIVDEILELLNKQITMELTAHFRYRMMAEWFHEKGLFGFTKWYETHAKEEYEHAEKIIQFLKERHARYRIDIPFSADPLALDTEIVTILENTLEHEEAVTASIYNIRTKAAEYGDQATEVLMDWFVEEQVEEEDIVQQILKKVYFVDSKVCGIYEIDEELGED